MPDPAPVQELEEEEEEAVADETEGEEIAIRRTPRPK